MKRISVISKVSLVALVLFLAGCGAETQQVAKKSDEARPAKLFKVQSPTSANVRGFPATTLANRYVDMSFRIAGELETLDLAEGQVVEKGQLLAQIDQRDAKVRLLEAEANFELAKSTFERNKKLLERQSISKSEYDLAAASFKSTKAALENAKNNLEYTELHAPFSGVIGRLSVKNYQYVQPQQPILLLQSTDKVDVQIQVPEGIYLSSRQDPLPEDFSPMLLFPGHSDKPYYVKYKEHSSEVDASTQSYSVTFTLDTPKDIYVVPGMSAELFVDLDIVAGKTQLKYLIPNQAVTTRDSDGKSIVWIYDEETKQAKSREVTLGQLTNSGIEVLSGLSGGEQIVAAGLNSIREGMKLVPLKWERGL
jgi:RND family efflux transporter MFP subunit